MTHAYTLPVACEACGSGSGTPMSDGTWFCFECRHQGPPASGRPVLDVEMPAPLPTPVPAPVDVPAVVTAEEGQAMLDELIGTEVVLDGGQRARIRDYPDDDHVDVALLSGDDVIETTTVEWGDIIRSADQPVPVVELEPHKAWELGSSYATIAALALRAALVTIEGTGTEATINDPPSGWSFVDADTIAVLEQGAAYALAIVKYGLQVSDDVWESLIDQLEDNVEVTEPEKGGIDDNQPIDGPLADGEYDPDANTEYDDGDVDPDLSGSVGGEDSA